MSSDWHDINDPGSFSRPHDIEDNKKNLEIEVSAQQTSAKEPEVEIIQADLWEQGL
jgi:hypothetical protein